MRPESLCKAEPENTGHFCLSGFPRKLPSLTEVKAAQPQTMDAPRCSPDWRWSVAALLDRRTFLLTSAGGLASPALGGCSGDKDAYRAALNEMTRPLPETPQLQDLIRFATLAANGHNTQPWKFRIGENSIDILPDLTRRTPVVDPDDQHLYASLGCAAENLMLAARARRFSGEAVFDNTGDGLARISLDADRRRQSDLLQAVTLRQCSRTAYNGKAASTRILENLKRAATRYEVDAVFVTDTVRSEEILSLVIAGNSRQVDDPAFVKELKQWVRFNPTTAARLRDGLYSESSGNPVLPDWLGPTLFDFFFDKESENEKYVEHVRTSAGIVVFVAKTDDRQGWFNAGRAYQRFALRATLDGLKNAFLNQAVEVPAVRKDLQALLGIGDRRPNLVVRYGYGPSMPRSLRRPVSAVLV